MKVFFLIANNKKGDSQRFRLSPFLFCVLSLLFVHIDKYRATI